MKLHLGIDPGLAGGIAVLDEAGTVRLVEPMPIAGKEVDAGQLARLVRSLRDLDNQTDYALAAVEHVGAMPGNGSSSMFNFGAGWGLVRGVLAALNVPVQLVRPQKWKGVVLAGTTHDKAGCVAWCASRFPSVSLVMPRCRKPHDGMADALALAEYARLKGG
jgi:crossover junction endodeoxyribonuclease RuvC